MLIYDDKSILSKYFYMYEVAKSETAARYLIDNTPTTPVLLAAQALAVNVLDQIKDHFGIPFSPTSWYRCEQLEKQINITAFKTWAARKGLPVNRADAWKQYFTLKSHPKGEAADIQIPGISNDILYKWIQENIPVYDQLIREYATPGSEFSGWVHVSYSLNTNRKQDLSIG